jgi:P pilus assembly chaperone PapD
MAREWMKSGRVAGLLLVLLACWAQPAAAVSVSPIALYLDQATRTGTLTLYNPGALAEEVEIGFAFGYPVSDSAGNVSVPLFDTSPAGEPSAVEWMRAFPRRLRLEPGQRQVVRVMAQPPAGLANGEYWARVLVRSRGGQPPIEQTQGAVTLQLNVETVVETERPDLPPGGVLRAPNVTAIVPVS